MAARGGAVKVRFEADTSDLSRGASRGEKDLDHFERSAGRSLSGLKTAALGAGAALAGGLVVGLMSSVKAAAEAEKSQARLKTQLKALDISYSAHAKEIDKVIQKTSQLAGLDDEDLQDAFTNIVRVTGDVNKSLRLTGLAADFARAKHIDVAKAGEIVGKVAGGNIGILSRYGITVQKGATASEALAALQGKFAGQAEAYGKTTAGSMDRASVAIENLQETVGAKLTPAVAVVANELTKLVNGGVTVENLQSRLRTSLGLSGKDFEQFKQTVSSVFRAVLPVAREVISGIVQRLQGMARTIGGVVKVISAVLHGDFRGAWQGVKQIFAGAIQSTIGSLRAATAPFRAAARAAGAAINSGFKAAVNLAHELAESMRDLIRKAPGYALGVGKAIVRGIISGIKAAAGGIGSAVKGAVGSAAKGLPDINPFGDGIGAGAIAPIQGAGNLMGAQPALGPFAGLGAKFGLHVSSGRRPGSITSSGNVSYHSSGEAIDVAGPPAGMLGFFKQMRSRFGSRLAELIYTPGGAGIKNGRPNVYTGKVAADHFDHVHVALDTGKPGVGDGLGKFTATSYGPPWGGIQGTGVTKTGVNLKDAPKRYGIAVDPSVLKLGQSYHVWPNPFGYRGTFKAFDTGGAIKGNRIDFYDWRGRKAQNSWGSRSVSVSTAGDKSTKGAASAGQAVSPYEQAVASADVAIAGAEAGTGSVKVGTRSVSRDLVKMSAVRNKQKILGARIRKIRKALKGKLRPATRLRLTQELAGLLPEHADLGRQVQTLLHPAADAGVDVGDAPSASDFGNAQLALAQLTPGTEDDLAALRGLEGIAAGDLASAQASGDPRKVIEAATTLKSLRDSIDSLTGATQSLQAQITSLTTELETQRQVSENVQRLYTTSQGQYSTLAKALADVTSGQLGARIGLGFMTPSFAGLGARY